MIRQAAIALRRIFVLFFVGMLVTAAVAQDGEPAGNFAPGLTSQRHHNPGPKIAMASIPFEFWVGAEKMPSGRYVLEIIIPSVALLRKDDDKAEQELFTQYIGGPVAQKEAKLIFLLRN